MAFTNRADLVVAGEQFVDHLRAVAPGEVEQRPEKAAGGAKQRHQAQQHATAGPGHPQQLAYHLVRANEPVGEYAAVTHHRIEGARRKGRTIQSG